MLKALLQQNKKKLHSIFYIADNGIINWQLFYSKGQKGKRVCHYSLCKLNSRPRSCWSLYPIASLASLDQIYSD